MKPPPAGAKAPFYAGVGRLERIDWGWTALTSMTALTGLTADIVDLIGRTCVSWLIPNL